MLPETMSAAVSTWVYVSALPNQCSCVFINAEYVSLHMGVTHARRCIWIQIVGCDVCVYVRQRKTEKQRGDGASLLVQSGFCPQL